MKNFAFLLTLALATMSNAFGQNKLQDNMVADSLIQNLRIRQVTENWFTNPNEVSPANTTYERYNESGKKIQRVHLNYSYHKFIHDYSYDLKKGLIIEKQKYYDWNPHREKYKNDTIVKTSTKKYHLQTGEDKNFKPGIFSQSQGRLTTDTLGRIIQRIDTVKCGYAITYYQYNDDSKLIERRHFISRHSEKTTLSAIYYFTYDVEGRKTKEVHYAGFKESNGLEEHDQEIETLFQYNNLGLVKEKLITTKYLSVEEAKPHATLFKYQYSFY